MDTDCQRLEFRYKFPIAVWAGLLVCIAAWFGLAVMMAQTIPLFLLPWGNIVKMFSLPVVMLLGIIFIGIHSILLARRGSVAVYDDQVTVVDWKGRRTVIPLSSISSLKQNTWSMLGTGRSLIRPVPSISILSQEGIVVHIDRALAGKEQLVDCVRSRAGLTETTTDWHYTYYLKPS